MDGGHDAPAAAAAAAAARGRRCDEVRSPRRFGSFPGGLGGDAVTLVSTLQKVGLTQNADPSLLGSIIIFLLYSGCADHWATAASRHPREQNKLGRTLLAPLPFPRRRHHQQQEVASTLALWSWRGPT